MCLGFSIEGNSLLKITIAGNIKQLRLTRRITNRAKLSRRILKTNK
jgi:hypothetical protein